jgi:hypothetical protein
VTTTLVKADPRLRVAALLRQWSLPVYLGLLATLCLLEVAAGALPTRIYGHDFFILLDGAWRIACGQTPNVDFYAGYGVLVLNPIRWALGLYHYDANAIGLTRAFYTALVGLWFLWLSRMKPRRAQSAVLGIFILVFVSAARPLGEYPTWLSHAMFYNRLGYAFLFLIMFEQLGAFLYGTAGHALSAAARGRLYFWCGVSTGAAVACAILTKISFVAPAVVLLSLGLAIFGIHYRHVWGMLAGCIGVFLVAVLLLHFHPLAFLQETKTLSQQRGRIAGDAVNTLVNEIGQELFALAAGVAVAFTGRLSRHAANRYMLATVVVVGCDIFCRATNAMRGDLPLAAFWCLGGALLLLSCSAASDRRTATQQRLIALLVLGPLAVQMFLMDLSSSVYSVYETVAARRHATVRFDSPRLRGWLPQDWNGEDPNSLNANGTPLITRTNDGIHLLQSMSRPDETVSTIAFSNPFSYALGRKPPQGGALWMDLDNNITVLHPVAEETIIGHPDLLMVEHSVDREGNVTQAVLSLYPDLLSKDFAYVGGSRYWTLYRRKR